jgi:hypothetical protein
MAVVISALYGGRATPYFSLRRDVIKIAQSGETLQCSLRKQTNF